MDMTRTESSSLKKKKKSAGPTAETCTGIQKLRKQWKDSLPPAWEPPKQRVFKHPEGTKIVHKSEAKKQFRLDDQELATLRCEKVPRASYLRDAYAYSYKDLVDLAKRKSVKLGQALKIEGIVYPLHGGGTSQTGEASTASAILHAHSLADYIDHYENASPPPLKSDVYTSPAQAATPDPHTIIWTPRKLMGPVTVDEACWLYCVTPEDIRDLSDHSPWIDVPTVAKRALTLHGGFYAHKELVYQRRMEEERALITAKEDRTAFVFSPIICKQAAHLAKTSGKDMLYDSATNSSTSLNAVAVLYPIKTRIFNENAVKTREWMPYWGDF
ncbi:hypothetical protein C8R43DRAFT_1015815 [Mycena crocata]|nr:hypothetical protein C8R43DRAFT_1015815 [Mycena crocata]